jgi:2-dehydro-3-deoxygluconokinase
MSEQRPRIISVGEVLLEMSRQGDGRFAIGCSGDTFNTAVYLARAGMDVAYATALGDDRYSDNIVALAKAENMATDLMLRAPGRLTGLCLVETDTKGERNASCWRDTSPARDLFELPDWGKIAEAMMGAQLIYFSGITLSLYSNTGLGRFLAVVELARKNGVKIAFDGNFRATAGRATCPARARCSRKRSSAPISRCRPTTMKPCYGAIRVRKPPSNACGLSESTRSW